MVCTAYLNNLANIKTNRFSTCSVHLVNCVRQQGGIFRLKNKMLVCILFINAVFFTFGNLYEQLIYINLHSDEL